MQRFLNCCRAGLFGLIFVAVACNRTAPPAGQTSAPATPDKPKEAASPKEPSLEGSWTTVSFTFNNAEGNVLNLFVKDFGTPCDKIDFEKGMLKCFAGKEKAGEASIRLDPAKNPKVIDLIIGKESFPGIYELKGDALRLCIACRRDQIRPTAFDTPKQEGTLVIGLKRAK